MLTQRPKVSMHCWINDTERLAQHRVATNPQFVLKKKKPTVFAKCNKVKHNKMRSSCV